jgi:hypothetical protein
VAGEGLQAVAGVGFHRQIDEATARAVQYIRHLAGNTPQARYTGRDRRNPWCLVVGHGRFVYDPSSHADDLRILYPASP